MKHKAFTLIEILISVCLILLLSGICILSINSYLNNKNRLESKIIDYVTITKYAKYNAEITGNKVSLIIEDNKLNVISQDYAGNETKLLTFKDQLDNINDNTIFESNDTNIISYLPDGNIENNNSLNISFDNANDTNVVSISINEWNKVTVITTNKVNDEDL